LRILRLDSVLCFEISPRRGIWCQGAPPQPGDSGGSGNRDHIGSSASTESEHNVLRTDWSGEVSMGILTAIEVTFTGKETVVCGEMTRKPILGAEDLIPWNLGNV